MCGFYGWDLVSGGKVFLEKVKVLVVKRDINYMFDFNNMILLINLIFLFVVGIGYRYF